ncbi:MAG: hypothetical protein KJ607_05175 [Bacteroidetes bacterium]|nr:hypothetical protein [Bacteroidota bacterium]
MKTKKLFPVLLLLLTSFTYAQDEELCPMHERYEKLKARKVAVITERLDLSVEEAQNFWPVYNEYEAKRDKLNAEKREAFKKYKNATGELEEKTLEELSDLMVQIEVDEANLRKEYHEKYKKVLPVKKVVELYHTEQQFKRDLLKEMRCLRGEGPHHGPPGE